ncbi:hypothetical protein Tco_0763433 [Tanacetum coccineum]
MEEELSSIFGRVEEEQSQCIWHIRGYRKLNKRALDLYVSNGNTAAIEAIGSFDLILPSGMILILDNCHFSPTIIRGVISLSRLWDNSFRHKFMDNGAISVSKDNIQQENHAQLGFYFSMTLSSDHINKKRITKLQHDGLLESTDDESFDVCVGYCGLCLMACVDRHAHTIRELENLNYLILKFFNFNTRPLQEGCVISELQKLRNICLSFHDSFECVGQVSLRCSGNTIRIMRRTLMINLVFTLCEEQVKWNSVLMRLIGDLLALDSIVRFSFSDRRLERTTTFSISANSE